MLRKILTLSATAFLAAFVFLIFAPASAQTLPVPSGIFTTDCLVDAADIDELACSPITKVVIYSQTLIPASVAAAVCAEQTFTVTGLATTDKVFFNPVATGNATAAGQVRVSAADTLAVTYCNPTAGALTPAAGSANIVALRS